MFIKKNEVIIFKEKIKEVGKKKHVGVYSFFPSCVIYIYLNIWNLENNKSVETAVSIYNNNWWDIYIWSNFFLTVWISPLILMVGAIVRLVLIKLLLGVSNEKYWMVPTIILNILAHIMFWIISLNMLLLFFYFF